VNEYCCASTRTITDPSFDAALPKLLSENSLLVSKDAIRMVSTLDGGIIAQCNPVKTTVSIRMSMIADIIIAHLRSILWTILIDGFSLILSLIGLRHAEGKQVHKIRSI
jgi:hypothetical protein